jgi:hypothetical protein
MKVPVHDGHDWARKCWSLKGMFDLSFAGTLTCIKLLVLVLRTFLPPYVSERFTILDHFFCFGEDNWVEFALHQVT